MSKKLKSKIPLDAAACSASYFPGMGCTCSAHDSSECGCGVDWTPTRQKQLEAEVLEQARLLGMSAEREAKLLAQLAAQRARADRMAALVSKLDSELGWEKLDALTAWEEARNE